MNLLDLLLLAIAILAVVGGYRLGFTARAVSWFGLAAGLYVSVKILPEFLNQLDSTNHNVVLVLTIGLLLVGASLGQALGFMIGSRLSPRRTDSALGAVDRSFGAVAGLLGVTVLFWLLLPVLVASPGWTAREAAGSWLAQRVDQLLPQAPDTMQALRSLVGPDAFPEVFDALRPTPELGDPPALSGLSAAVMVSTSRSVAKIEGVACDRIQDGTGFVARDDLVVTNAHVVAGEKRTTVIRDDGRQFNGTVIAFDPQRDLAIISVPGFGRPALPIQEAAVKNGTSGGVFGHPGGEPLRVAPFSVARTLSATGRDIYGSGVTERQVLELASSLRPGDSGSPIVDPGGAVVGIAFAIARDRSGVAYALSTAELASVFETLPSGGVSTGPCLN
jgi:S1-C subfamily serine protease